MANKKEMITLVAEKAGMTKKDAEKFIEAFEEVVMGTLQSGEEVNLVNFGKFYVVDTDEREGHNPKTGEPLTIPAKKSPKFKFCKGVKDSFKK